jgi:hypothetical protein
MLEFVNSHILSCERWSSHSGVAEDSSLLGRHVVPQVKKFPTFRRKIVLPSWSTKQSKTLDYLTLKRKESSFFRVKQSTVFDWLALEDGSNTFLRNVGNYLTYDTAPYRRRPESSRYKPSEGPSWLECTSATHFKSDRMSNKTHTMAMHSICATVSETKCLRYAPMYTAETTSLACFVHRPSALEKAPTTGS